jgi:hypothetical protein
MTIKIFPVFHVSAVVGNFFLLPMAHGHKMGTANFERRGSIFSGVIPFPIPAGPQNVTQEIRGRRSLESVGQSFGDNSEAREPGPSPEQKAEVIRRFAGEMLKRMPGSPNKGK